MTTSKLAGRAAHDWKPERFNIRRVVFELFLALSGQTSSKCSSIYHKHEATRISNPIEQQQRRVCDSHLMLISSSLQYLTRYRRYDCIDGILAYLDAYQNDIATYSSQLKVTPVCAGLQFNQMSSDIQFSREPDTGHSDRHIPPVLPVPCRASEELYSSDQYRNALCLKGLRI